MNRIFKICILTLYTTALVFVIFISVGNTRLHVDGLPPHSAKKDYHTYNTISSVPENLSYKEWCEDNFPNGTFIYEAYRQISFKISYAQEPAYNDFWQTPLETFHRCAGDCEDVVLYFNNILPEQFNSGEMVWGVIENLNDNIEYAHVWFELHNTEGEVFFIEPHTKGWNGIIPIELLKDKRIKKKTLSISCDLIRDLLNNHLKIEAIRKSIVKEETTFDQIKDRFINDIISKLKRVSRRYIDQKRIIKRVKQEEKR